MVPPFGLASLPLAGMTGGSLPAGCGVSSRTPGILLELLIIDYRLSMLYDRVNWRCVSGCGRQAEMSVPTGLRHDFGSLTRWKLSRLRTQGGSRMSTTSRSASAYETCFWNGSSPATTGRANAWSSFSSPASSGRARRRSARRCATSSRPVSSPSGRAAAHSSTITTPAPSTRSTPSAERWRRRRCASRSPACTRRRASSPSTSKGCARPHGAATSRR